MEVKLDKRYPVAASVEQGRLEGIAATVQVGDQVVQLAVNPASAAARNVA